MEDVKRAGRTGHPCGSATSQLIQVNDCSIITPIIQVECHRFLYQSKLLQFCRSHRIVLSPSAEAQWASVDPWSWDKVFGDWADATASAYRIQRNVVVIPRAVQLVHLESNYGALSLDIGDVDMIKLNLLNRNHRHMKFERCSTDKYYPYNVEFWRSRATIDNIHIYKQIPCQIYESGPPTIVISYGSRLLKVR